MPSEPFENVFLGVERADKTFSGENETLERSAQDNCFRELVLSEANNKREISRGKQVRRVNRGKRNQVIKTN